MKKIMMRRRSMDENEDITRWRRMRMETQGWGPTSRMNEMMRMRMITRMWRRIWRW
jgi:hypothetical protein